MKKSLLLVLTSFFLALFLQAQKAPQVKIANGLLQGIAEKSGVQSFKGVPYAAPPTGANRWKEPQPVKNWKGTRKADHFGPRAMQPPIFSDMNFRSDGMSEDCLYLNVWSPDTKTKTLLPVLVYFYGGGFVAGDGSEPRYDGESMARKGIVALTVNYRLGVFGFMAHPELTKESPHQASGNYALLDQAAALKWVHDNITAFGGDPSRVTIAGESAGSVAVSAQMASPLSRDLIAGAIGESGSVLGTLSAVPLADAEANGVAFAKTLNVTSLEALRRLPADSILNAASRYGPFRFSAAIDGYFFPKTPLDIYEAGEQAKVPLLAGWNSEESGYGGLLEKGELTKSVYQSAVKKWYGDHSEEILKQYPVKKDEEVAGMATALASDRFIGYSTWKWITAHNLTATKPVYRYFYERPRPRMVGDSTAPAPTGASHSAEIEYAMGNLESNKVFAWNQEDYEVSRILQEYFANFIKTGNPNGPGLPSWQSVDRSNKSAIMHINVASRVELDQTVERYLLLDRLAGEKR